MDNQLENTINDITKKADSPENLVFGLCIQDTEEELNRYKTKFTDSNFKVLYVKYTESKGCCWARSLVQNLIEDEKYYIQLDAHHRFVESWDTQCLKMLKQCNDMSKSSKVILSTYATPCNLKDDVMNITHQNRPYKIRCELFYDTRKVRYVPEAIMEDLDAPFPSYTISAHFLFTYMDWVRDIPYDPQFYFEGEEDSLALRTFTKGWQMYCPNQIVCYHYYIRNGEKRHSDHDKLWYKKNDKSFERFYKLLENQVEEPYGLGFEKSIHDYFVETGIDYINKVIIKKTPSVHKLNFKPLSNEKLKLITKEDAEIVLDFHYYVFCYKNNIWNEYKPDDLDHWCHFEQTDETDEYYDIFDSGRDVHIRLLKDMTMILVKVGSYNEFSLLYKTPIQTVKKIENASKVCIFNTRVPNENNIKYCENYKFDYICFNEYFDIEATFESYSLIYDLICYVPENVYFLGGKTRTSLNQIIKYGNIMSPDFSLRVNSQSYKQIPKGLLEYNPKQVKKSTMLLKTTDENIIQKIVI